MPSLADIIEQSRASVSGNPSFTNADLTPAARRKRLDLDETVPAADVVPKAPYVAPDGGIVEQNRLLDEAKGTLKRVDPFARMLENAGNVGAQESLRSHETPGEAIAQSLGDTAVGVYKGARQVPGDLLGGVLGLPGAIVQGYESLPEGLKAIVDPATWRGMPDAAKQSFMSLANDPETATRLFGGLLAAGPASDIAGMGLAKAPGAVGGAISKVGRGMQAVGQSPLVEGTGLLRKAGAVVHPGIGTVLAAVGPEMLGGAGRAIERFGGKVSNIPNSASLEALKNLANKDVGATVRDALTPAATADELAAGSVRATVDTARDLVAKGQTRGQAAQRAGWPLAGDFTLDEFGRPVNKYGTGDFGTHPGQNVEAHRPYEPAVRGKAGNAVQEGRNSPGSTASSLGALDDLAGPTNRVRQQDTNPILEGIRNPDRYARPQTAQELLDQPGSQKYMNEQFIKNKPVMDAAQEASDAVESERLMNALGAHRAAADAQFDTHLTGPEVDVSNELAKLSDLDRASRRARARSKARGFSSNSPSAEGY